MIKFKNILEELFTMPKSFNIELFEALPSYAKRKQYIIKTGLRQIGKGSGRIVYNIDNEYVLKFAWNKKGLAQNKEEISFYNDGALGEIRNIFSKLETYDKNGFYNIQEYCSKVKASYFKENTGINFKLFEMYVNSIEHNVYNNSLNFVDFLKEAEGAFFNPEEKNVIEITEWGNFLTNCIQKIEQDGFDISVADFKGLRNFGVNKEGNVVIVDYGLNEEIYNTMYNTPRQYKIKR